MIDKCRKNCENEFQDKTYGKGNRVLNPCGKENEYRCTVCGERQYISKKAEKQ